MAEYCHEKRICLILPGKLPVPNIRGGAIETLLTLLIDQNEIHGKVHFIVICAWAEGIEEVAAQYKNTEFHYFKIRADIWKKGINFVNYLVAKVTGNIDFFPTPMHHDIKKIVKTIKADAVVVEHGVYKHFSFLRKYFRRDQLYLHIHGTGPMMDKATKKTFGHVITVSEFVKNLYIHGFDGYKTIFHVCRNGIDDKNFKKQISDKERKELRAGYGVTDEDLLVIYCGRLVHEKGVKEIINGIIGTHNEHIKLMIVGGSNFQDSSVTGYVKELYDLANGHSSQVFFTGYLPNDELYKYYQMSDIQAICSICEDAAPLTAIEGTISGLPMIVTDSGGVSEYTKDNVVTLLNKKSALVNKDDADMLSKQISSVLNSIDRTLIASIRRSTMHISNDFGADKFYKDFIDTVR